MPVAIMVAGVAALEDNARLPKIAAAADTAPRRVVVWLELNAETNVGISTSNETKHCMTVGHLDASLCWADGGASVHS